MDLTNNTFSRKKSIPSKLISFGFECHDAIYRYQTMLAESKFLLTVVIDQEGSISSELLDPSTNEPYTLHLAAGAVGSFVGSVRSEYEKILADIAEKCFEPDIFKTIQAKQIIKYINKTYGDQLEYLWKKFPDNAIWRRTDNKKWYGVLLAVSQRKLGLKKDETIEIIDLRYPPEDLTKLIDNKTYFPGWHMNKTNWYTIILNESVSTEEIFHLIDKSYKLAKQP